MALSRDGTVWAWGDGENGLLGTGQAQGRSLVPVQVTGLTGVTQIVAGSLSDLALKRRRHRLGLGIELLRPARQRHVDDEQRTGQVNNLSGISMIGGQAYQFLAVRASDGSVWDWGQNDVGQLGVGDQVDRNAPVHVPGLTGVTAIGGGYGFSLAQASSGTVYGWGAGGLGELGTGGDGGINRSPIVVNGITNVGVLAGGSYHSVALTSSGTTEAWGDNQVGQLGRGNNPGYLDVPAPVSGVVQALPGAPSGVAAVAGNQLAYLTWTASTASVVTQYVITPYVNGVAQQPIGTGSPQTSYAVTGLTRG